MVFPHGTVDFSANGAFDGLDDFEQDRTTFTYGIEGGDTATLTVNVWGLGDLGGDGGGLGEGGFRDGMENPFHF